MTIHHVIVQVHGLHREAANNEQGASANRAVMPANYWHGKKEALETDMKLLEDAKRPTHLPVNEMEATTKAAYGELIARRDRSAGKERRAIALSQIANANRYKGEKHGHYAVSKLLLEDWGAIKRRG